MVARLVNPHANRKTLGIAALAVGALLAVAFAMWHRPTGRAQSGLTARPDKPPTTEIVGPALADGHVTTTRPDKLAYAVAPTGAPGLAASVDRNARDRVAADITSRIPRIRHEEDVPAVVSVLLDTQDDDTVRNEAANLLRRSAYDELTDNLVEVLDNPKERARFRAFCVQHLWMNLARAEAEEREKITSTLHRSLDDRHVPVRREALLALVRTRDPRGREVAVKWLAAEKADGVRDAAIRCVREFRLREQIPTIRKYLRDENDVVRIAAIVTLSQWGDEESRPAIEEAAKSKSFRLRRCAEMALKRLDSAASTEAQAVPGDKTRTIPAKGDKPAETF